MLRDVLDSLKKPLKSKLFLVLLGLILIVSTAPSGIELLLDGRSDYVVRGSPVYADDTVQSDEFVVYSSLTPKEKRAVDELYNPDSSGITFSYEPRALSSVEYIVHDGLETQENEYTNEAGETETYSTYISPQGRVVDTNIINVDVVEVQSRGILFAMFRFFVGFLLLFIVFDFEQI